MAKLKALFRCICEAVCFKGLKGLLKEVPFGGLIFDIASDSYERFKDNLREEEQLEVIREAAQASPPEARQVAVEVVREDPACQALPRQAKIDLVSYLTQVPSTVRRTMKRPSDPAGKTVPASFTLKKPEQMLSLLPQRLPSFKAGDRIGDWELEELLGAGGFGEVWLAHNPSLPDLKAALKFCLDASAASALRHEATMLTRVMRQGRHPGIVPLQQAYLDREPLCLAFEYVNGGDLTSLLNEWQRNGKIPRTQVNRLMLWLAEIVAHAHELNPPIVHRDLKPANILIDRSPDNKIRLRVTDFGIGGVAAHQSLQATKRGATSRGEQIATAIRGAHTPIYASPEQVNGAPPDVRDDVFSLGVIWYQMLTGNLTAGVPADWEEELRDRGQSDKLIRLLGECVAGKPEKRLGSAGVLARRLSEELDPIPMAQPVDEPPERKEGRASRRSEEQDLPPRTPPRTIRPGSGMDTVRRESPRTQRGGGEVLPEVEPVDDRPSRRETRRAPRPPELPANPPRPPRTPAPGNQIRRFHAPGLRTSELLRDLENWLAGEGFNTQNLATEDGAALLQIRKQGGWRQWVGMDTALNIVVDLRGDDLSVEIGAGKWADKAAAGVVSLFVLWPLAVTAAIGAWNQMKMPERIYSRVNELVSWRQSRQPAPEPLPAPAVGAAPTAGLKGDTISQLKELAALRDQGILTDEEFQAEKARLLGR